MKRLMINFMALLVIGLGVYQLLGVQTAEAATTQIRTSATCSCEGSGGSSTCSGDKCSCDGGTCNSCDNRLLGFIKCKL